MSVAVTVVDRLCPSAQVAEVVCFDLAKLTQVCHAPRRLWVGDTRVIFHFHRQPRVEGEVEHVVAEATGVWTPMPKPVIPSAIAGPMTTPAAYRDRRLKRMVEPPAR